MTVADRLAPNGTAICHDRDLPRAALVGTVINSLITIVQPFLLAGR
jgi:hypothetical protein